MWWYLWFCDADHCHLHCSSCTLYFYPKAFPEEDEHRGDWPSLLKVSKTFHSTLPSKFEQPAVNITTQPDVFDWHAQPYTTGQSQSPWGCPCPWHCDMWAQIPNVMLHLLMASKHPWEQETLTDGWNAFKKTPRDSQGDAEPCQWWWVITYAQQKMPKGRAVPAPTKSTGCWLSAALHRMPFAFAKCLLNTWSLSLVP